MPVSRKASQAKVSGSVAKSQDIDLVDAGTLGESLNIIMTQSRNVAERGRWFEELVLKLLRREPDFSIAKAWLWADWPDKPTARGAQDLGVDIIARTHDGQTIAVQCKCLNRDKKISKSIINSFLAEAAARKEYDALWLLANAELNGNAVKAIRDLEKECKHINVFRYQDVSLSPLESPDKRHPNLLQQAAIRKVLEGLSGENASDRGKLIMACGSGKTFTALRIAEDMHRPDTKPLFLFAAPSIALVGQARREWVTHTRSDQPMSTIVVCSSSVEGRAPSADAATDLSAHELACCVTTDPVKIAAFMQQDNRQKAVFSTYQSLHRVVVAQSEHGAPNFDLAIADEAHRTTGAFDPPKKLGPRTDWRLFLDEGSLRADKRLFMTATPRIYTSESKDAARKKQGVCVVDMNDPAYGVTLHRLSFREAVQNELLCDYRVIVLAINSETRLTKVVQQAFKAAQDDAKMGQREVSPAEQIRLFGVSLAINGAVEGRGMETPKSLPRTLAFSNTCAVSRWVARAISDGRTQRLTSFRLPERDRTARKVQATHLDAKTPGHIRLVELDRLRQAQDTDCRMISNVRLFSEGVDIPALDGVVFFEPKRSQIDIVQAVGRVMRKAPGKKMGFIVVPTVVPPYADVLDALKDSTDGFERIGAVLQALQAHDPSLADSLSEYVHIVQPKLPEEDDSDKDKKKKEKNGDGDKDPKPQEEFRFDLSKGTDTVFAHIGAAAGFNSRKDLVAGHLQAAVDNASARLLDMQLAKPMAQALGLPHDSSDEEEHKKEQHNAAALSALLLINAMMLGDRLARNIDGIDPDCIARLPAAKRPYRPCRRAWMSILERDYAPIFRPAIAVLDVLGGTEAHAPLINSMAEAALDVSSTISDFSYDHSGPLFHRILGKRGEADGAYYSNNLAALLLAGLAVPKLPDRPLRVLDPACGTGTLLLAVMDMVKRHAKADGASLNEAELHRQLVENSIHGLDINHHAAQFAAANLTLGAPEVNYERMNLAALRDGVLSGKPAAGSLELLPRSNRQTCMNLGDVQATLPSISDLPDAKGSANFRPGDMDLIITNPPFTEINKLLKKIPGDDDKKLMREHLKGIKRETAEIDPYSEPVLRGTRSIQPFFIPLANHLLRKDAGTLAMINPATVLTSPADAVKAQRQYFARNFHVETVVTSHAPPATSGLGINFSEDTSVHEALLVLRRWPSNKPKPATSCVSLHKQPDGKNEALTLLEAIHTGGNNLNIWGKRVEWPSGRMEAGDWSFANWYDADLAEQALKVRAMDGLVELGDNITVVGPNPNFKKVYEDAEEHQPFDQRIFASVSSDLIRTMQSEPDHPVRLRNLPDEKHLAAVNCPARTFLAFRMDPSVARAILIHTSEPTISTAFTGLLARVTDSHYERAVVAFLNSTLGWLQVLNQRAFKLSYIRIKPIAVRRLMVPSPHSPAVKPLAQAFEMLKEREMSKGRNAGDCPVRTELDEAVAGASGLPADELHELRKRIAQEPSVARNSPNDV